MVKPDEEFERSLRELGFRLTPQRLLILSVLQGTDEHISAEEIHSLVRQRYPFVDISTVYRTLEVLKGMGLVMETDLGEGRVRYHWAEKGRHHHLVCRQCGAVMDLEESVPQMLGEALRREYGFQADLAHLAIFGRCRRCQG